MRLNNQDTVIYKIVDNNEQTKNTVLDLLHEYPTHFLQGLFEPVAETDLLNSVIAIAYSNGTSIGCLMYNPTDCEFNWLAISKKVHGSKRVIAQGLFETLYTTIPKNTKVHLFVNTEDATVEGYPKFSGKNFEPARKFYRSMGLEIKQENRVENKFGPGAHAYKVSWIPNK